MMFRFPSVICTRCTGFFCLAIIKGPPNDIYCIIEEPYKHYFTEKVSYSPQNKSTSALAAIVFLSISFFIYVSSYFIIFEANYFPPDMFTDDVIIPTEDNCFVIKCPDGQYDFYLNGEYIETLPDKEHCIIGITTYKNIQEARKHEKIISEK